jgi:hypothetical protein
MWSLGKYSLTHDNPFPTLRWCDFIDSSVALTQNVVIVAVLCRFLSVLLLFLDALFIFRLWIILSFGDLLGNRGEKNLCLEQEEHVRLKLIIARITDLLQFVSG